MFFEFFKNNILMFNINIRDSNTYFSFGLRIYLADLFSEIGKSFFFFDSSDKLSHVDIVFHSTSPDLGCVLAFPQVSREFNGLVFFIMEGEDKQARLKSECLKSFPVIFRDDPLSVVRSKVLRQVSHWQKGQYGGIISGSCATCGRARLTENEMKVITLLSKERSLTDTAWILGKNVKTVFSQKKSAMKKLNLRNRKSFIKFIVEYRNMIGKI